MFKLFLKVILLLLVSLLGILHLRSNIIEQNIDLDANIGETVEFDEAITELVQSKVAGIMNPDATDCIHCPPISSTRYKRLQSRTRNSSDASPQRHNATGGPREFFFALDLFNVTELIEPLLSAVVQSVQFLGPERCTISIVEGQSTDGTWDILSAVRSEFENLGVLYYLTKNNADPLHQVAGGDDRITTLAKLRNAALEPLFDPQVGNRDTAIVFINDLVLCAEDILEMILQRIVQEADMTCAMDWDSAKGETEINIFFYDVWVARVMNGDTFFKLDSPLVYNHYADLFHSEPIARARYEARKPFQVLSCWNGIVVMPAQPFLEEGLRFRSARDDECFEGEPQILTRDLWALGYERIAVVPSVNVAYGIEKALVTKTEKGYVSDSLEDDDGSSHEPDLINWNAFAGPPNAVKCLHEGPQRDQMVWTDWPSD